MKLRVSDNRRFLTYEDGVPFFYLGDTAWELFHRLTLPEAELYLRDRAAKRFTVIQAVVLAELDGLTVPNPAGDLPLKDNDPARPVEAYFKHVDAVIDLAASLGLHTGLLPTWGDKWNRKWGQGPEIFTPENARQYGRFLGKRYRGKPLIWILGGDRPVETDGHHDLIRATAVGLCEGDDGEHLIAFHPAGGQTSAERLHDEPWLDFNMWQTGHDRNRGVYACVAADYALEPAKPCMDAEPGYEDHPAGFDLANGYLDDYDIRKSAYWALFSGAHGHTYGAHPVWQMYWPGREPVSFVRRTWLEALSLPGAGQMQHARALLESRPFLTRVPDQSLLTPVPEPGTHYACATRDERGSFAFVYCPSPRPVHVDLTKLSGGLLVAYWYDPRTGTAARVGTFARASVRFTPPPVGPDWVLVLDDATYGFPLPGSSTLRSTL